MDEAPEEGKAPRVKHSPSPFLIAVPLIVTNAVAIGVQALWAHEEAERQWPALAGTAATIVLAVGWAIALESIAVYLSGMAHAKRLSNQSSGLLQGAAYVVALGIAALNYSHLANGWLQPTSAALGAAFLSAVSPWLWSVYSQYRSRERLIELGLVDPRAPKFSTANKVLHPYRTASAIRQAVWEGETSPDRARRAWEAKRARQEGKARGNEARTAEAFPERDRRPVIRPVIIQQHRTTVRRTRVEITETPRLASTPEPPASPWTPRPLEAPVSAGTRRNDDEYMPQIRALMRELERVPGREAVKARLRVSSTRADRLLARLREEQAS